MTAVDLVTATAVISTGLMAGLFFGWAVSVIPGTRRADDAAYIETMQHINRAIVNPGFVVPFIGTPFALVAAAVMQHRSGNTRAAIWLAASAVTYVVGLLGITVGANIPLNNALDAFELQDADTDTDASAQRRVSYERPWNRWHAVRTAAVTIAFGCAVIATISESE